MAKSKDPITLTDEELLTRIQTEYKTALDFRRPRVAEWHLNEQILYGKKPITLSKRSNIMINFAAGFQDALLAKIKNPPFLDFEPTEEGDTLSARKVTALWKKDSGVTNADWEYKDLMGKKLAIPTGRCINKIHSRPKPYKHFKDLVDTYDFLIDPLAGGLDIERGRYMGQDNILKTPAEMKENESYNQTAVQELIANGGDNETKANIDNIYKEKQNRMAAVGMAPETYNIQMDGIFKLLEWYTTIDGVRYYALVSLDFNKVLKRCPLSDIFSPEEKGEQPLWPFRSWAYYPDAFNFWSPAPMDLVREIFMTRNVTINQIIDNNEAKNKPMKSYDPGVYLRPEKLEYRPDGLVPVAKGSNPKEGLFIHETPSLYDPKLLNEILEDLVGKITGITAAVQGGEDNKQRVGIYYGNMQEIAGRMGLFDLSYTRCYIQEGQLYLRCLRDHMGRERAIRVLGANGAEWDTVTKEDLTSFDISFSGGVGQAQNDAMKAKQKADFVNNLLISPNPAIQAKLNIKFAVEQGATAAGFTEKEADRLMDKEEEEEYSHVRAEQDIEKLLLGEIARPWLKADPAYLQHIFDFRYENDLEPEVDRRFGDYIERMKGIVMQNLMIKAKGMQIAATMGMGAPAPAAPGMGGDPTAQGGAPVPANAAGATPLPVNPDPGTPGATSQQAGEMSDMMKETYQ